MLEEEPAADTKHEAVIEIESHEKPTLKAEFKEGICFGCWKFY